MSSTRPLTGIMPRNRWIDAFAMRLGQMAPTIAASEAAMWAERTFEEAADLPPEKAAEIFASDIPPLDEGAPE